MGIIIFFWYNVGWTDKKRESDLQDWWRLCSFGSTVFRKEIIMWLMQGTAGGIIMKGIDFYWLIDANKVMT